jgi:hypothetical protein
LGPDLGLVGEGLLAFLWPPPAHWSGGFMTDSLLSFQGGYRNDIPAISRKEERQTARAVKKDASYRRSAGTGGRP